VGATTENPSFEVNAALLSRCRVYVLQPLGEDDLVGILARALADTERGLGGNGVTADEDALRITTRLASGDARSALNILDLAVALEAARPDGRRRVTEEAIREAVQKKALLYDKSGEEHYNLISALHKSMRNSDPDASVYWLARMLEAGEDPLYVARRLVRFASEDVGNADPQALTVAVALHPRVVTEAAIREAVQKKALLYDKSGEEHYNLISALHKSLRDSDPDASLYWMTRMLDSGEDPLYVARRLVRFASEDVGNADPLALTLTLAAKDAYDFLGSPEGELALAQATLYLAMAPKSNAAYVAYNEARADVGAAPAEPVPLHIRNAPTGLMKDLGYGRGYQYAHDAPEARVDQEHLPESLRGRRYYRPTDRGLEAELSRRLDDWRRWREQQRQPK